MSLTTQIFIYLFLFCCLFSTVNCKLSPKLGKFRPTLCPETCRPYLSNVICDVLPFSPRIDILTLEFSTVSGIRPISLIENLRSATNQSINFVFNFDGYPKIYDIVSGRRINPEVLIASGICVSIDLAVDLTNCPRQRCRFNSGRELAEFLNSQNGRAFFGVKSSFAYVHGSGTKDKMYFVVVCFGISLIFMATGIAYSLISCYRLKSFQIRRSSSAITTMSFFKTDNDFIKDLQMQISTDEQSLGQTILHLAVTKNLSAFIPLLIERGFDPNVQRKDGESPLSLAVKMNSLSCVDELLKIDCINLNHSIGPNDTPLKRAVAMGNVGLPIVKALLKRPGIDVNAVGDRCNCLSVCQTPLHAAVIHGNVTALNELLKKNADRRIADEEQKTPMHYALERGNVDIIRLLIDRNDVHFFDINRYSIC